MDKMTRQTYKSWAGKTAQEIKHIFHKRDGLSLNQRLHVQLDTVVQISDLSAAGHRGVHPWSQCCWTRWYTSMMSALLDTVVQTHDLNAAGHRGAHLWSQHCWTHWCTPVISALLDTVVHIHELNAAGHGSAHPWSQGFYDKMGGSYSRIARGSWAR